MIELHYWELFSKKLREKLDRLKFTGSFSLDLAQQKNMRLILGIEKNLTLYWLVDEADGVIADAKFQAYGPIGLIAAAEIASELVLRKNYDQASKLTADLIDKHVRDKKEQAAFPKECYPYLNLVLSAIDNGAQQCTGIPFALSHDVTPIEYDFGSDSGGIVGWEEFPQEQKMKIIEEIIDKEIRPYIELDAGGITVVNLREGKEVIIAYEGACTTCHSSTGSTLTAIQQILKSRIHPSLFVTPSIA